MCCGIPSIRKSKNRDDSFGTTLAAGLDLWGDCLGCWRHFARQVGVPHALLRSQQPPVAAVSESRIRHREHVADHRGNIGDHGPPEFRFEGFGDGLRKPGNAPNIKPVGLRQSRSAWRPASGRLNASRGPCGRSGNCRNRISPWLWVAGSSPAGGRQRRDMTRISYRMTTLVHPSIAGWTTQFWAGSSRLPLT